MFNVFQNLSLKLILISLSTVFDVFDVFNVFYTLKLILFRYQKFLIPKFQFGKNLVSKKVSDLVSKLFGIGKKFRFRFHQFLVSSLTADPDAADPWSFHSDLK